jgi:hypothetical protein
VLTKTNIVEEFIKDYQRSRVVAIASVRATMNRALEFEKKFNKAFYEFTEDEVIEMYKSVDAISARSLQNLNLILGRIHFEYIGSKHPATYNKIIIGIYVICSLIK